MVSVDAIAAEFVGEGSRRDHVSGPRDLPGRAADRARRPATTAQAWACEAATKVKVTFHLCRTERRSCARPAFGAFSFMPRKPLALCLLWNLPSISLGQLVVHNIGLDDDPFQLGECHGPAGCRLAGGGLGQCLCRHPYQA
jgi:hypothetical protein